MPDLRAILRRFRPLVVPPGLPSAATIPIDAGAALTSELATIVRLIDEIDDAAEQLEARAQREADRLVAEADASTRSLVRAATAVAGQERAKAYTTRRRPRDAEIRAEHSRARREVARIHQAAQARMPELIERVVDCVVASTAPAAER